MIQLRNIEKSFRSGLTRTYILRQINLDVKEGEFISIMGPSGAGKSTLLHIIGLHDASWSGDYFFEDVAVHKIKQKNAQSYTRKTLVLFFNAFICLMI